MCILQSFSLALGRLRKKVEGRFGRIRTLETDDDTRYTQLEAALILFGVLTCILLYSFLKTFNKHVDRLGIRRIVEKRFNKISHVERMGGLFKRHLATLARKKNVPWHVVLNEAEKTWNSSYVSKLQFGVPDDWNYKNYDQLIARLYQLEPIRAHALFSVRSGGHDERVMRELFKFEPGDSVRVSMRTLNKRIQGPVRNKPCLNEVQSLSRFLSICSFPSTTASCERRAGPTPRSWPDGSASPRRRTLSSPSTY